MLIVSTVTESFSVTVRWGTVLAVIGRWM